VEQELRLLLLQQVEQETQAVAVEVVQKMVLFVMVAQVVQAS
jgi:hypothetical protein